MTKEEEIREAVYLLRQFNEWRRGGDGEMPNPTDIGIAIDRVCDAAESNLPLVAMIEKLRVQLQLALEEVVNLTFDRDQKITKHVG